METRFTPGPWQVFTTADGRSLLGVGDRNSTGISDCGDVTTNDLGIWRSGKERRANAALIAAAPALYEALHGLFIQALQSELNDSANEWGRDAILAARAALALARGETSQPESRVGLDPDAGTREPNQESENGR